jgi:hypothetical protein
VPGFINHKPPSAPVELIEANSRRYTLADLLPFAAEERAIAKAPSISTVTIPQPISPELGERFRVARLQSPEMTTAWHARLGDGSSDSRYGLVHNLLRAGFSGSEVLSIVCSRHWYNRRAKRYRPDKEVARDVVTLLAKLGQPV